MSPNLGMPTIASKRPKRQERARSNEPDDRHDQQQDNHGTVPVQHPVNHHTDNPDSYVALRSPLEWKEPPNNRKRHRPASSTTGSSELDAHYDDNNHDRTLRPMLCAMLVACDVLRVSVDTQFTAAVLLHR